MAVEHVADTPDAIEFFRLSSLEGRLKLEQKGIKFRINTRTALKQQGFGNTREEQLAEIGRRKAEITARKRTT